MEFLISQAQHKPWLSTRVQQMQIDTEINTISAATTLTAQTEDQVVAFSSAGTSYTITLPTLASAQSGQKFLFSCAAAAGTNTVTITSPDGAKILGSFLIVGGATPAITDEGAAGVKTNVICGTALAAGDFLQFWCDGTKWRWFGFTHGSALTFS